ncbi:MAG: hypothetical protein P8X57_08230 [Cyclobacteriaceae bacterium]
MRLLRYLNIWSIDVALAAGLLSVAFAHVWSIAIPVTVPALLAIVVWLIYTLDHIKDSFDTQAPGLSERRNLHRKHFKKLLSVSVVLLIFAGGLIFMVPEPVVVYGTALSSIVGAYYLVLHFLSSRIVLKKEVIVALLYTTGKCGTIDHYRFGYHKNESASENEQHYTNG